MAMEQTASSPVPTVKTYIAIADQEQPAILSTAASTAITQSFQLEPPLAMEALSGRVLLTEPCHASGRAPTDLLLVLMVSMSIAIVHQEPPVQRPVELSFAGIRKLANFEFG